MKLVTIKMSNEDYEAMLEYVDSSEYKLSIAAFDSDDETLHAEWNFEIVDSEDA